MYNMSKRKFLLGLSLLLVFNESLQTCCSETTGSASGKQYKSNDNLQNVRNIKADAKQHLVAEMAIVADHAFGQRFNHNLIKMLEYLQILFIDVQTRFRTLPSVSISFRINTFSVLTVEQERVFVAYHKLKKDHVDIRSTLGIFQIFAHTFQKSTQKFDIAMALLTAPAYNDISSASFQDGVCQEDEVNQRIRSSFVISLAGSENIAAAVTREIAHLLGVKYDDHEECQDVNDATEQYIMSRKFSPTSTHFSSCSDKQMAKFLKSEKADCLRRLDHRNNTMTFFNTSSSMRISESGDISITSGIPVEDQCRIIKKDSSGWCFPREMLWKNEETCGYSQRCISGSTCLINPMDATPCGDGEKRRWCFRGKCVPVGVQFGSVLTDECIVSKNLQASGDTPKMRKCDQLLTPLDLIVIRDMGPRFGNLLVMPYSLPERMESLEKCLMLRPMNNKYNEFSLKFAKCPDVNEVGITEAEFFGWNITLLEYGYLVTHYHFQNICLKVLPRGHLPGLLTAAECSENPGDDDDSLWLILNEGGKFIANLTKFIDVAEEMKEDSGNGLFSKVEFLVGELWKWKDEL